ncbi:DNA repair protein xrcc1 [Bulinus truncatus]|nr:DNA repair protein xrcc1 [Bulinus truncatus]
MLEMPIIELQHIVSCSSEDKNNPAENLLKSDGSHKWKSSTPGEKSISCIIQLSKSSQIQSIHIGNEGSAFVEVLVGKATATQDTDFEVLLVASSFMSPLDSRNETKKTSVRIFSLEDLNKQTASQSWDRIKIVCTQPFSKLFQYGLSFVKFYSPPAKENEEPRVKKLGAFTIKEDADDDDIHIGSLFANRLSKETTSPFTPTGAAAIRLASKHPEDLVKTLQVETPVRKKRQAESPPTSESKSKTPMQERDLSKEVKEDKTHPVSLKRQSSSFSSISSSSTEKSAMKRTNTEPSKTSPAQNFRKIMEKVVFVLSGFQNPHRGQLRDKALEMGAKYRPDWGNGCTHLICAFTNTPKYQQVAGKGKIVTKEWILDCHKQKKLLPWRKYRLGKAPSPPPSSDEDEKSSETLLKQRNTTATIESDSDSDPANNNNKPVLDKVVANKKIENKDDDPYSRSTDEEADDDNKKDLTVNKNDDSELPDLPEFFTDKTFFFYGEIEPSERRLLTRYIAAYNGEVADYMNKSVNFVITTKKWDSNFDEALSENPHLFFVKPKWIHQCHEKNKLIPYQHHVIVP